MNTLVKKVLFISFGALVGGVSGYFLGGLIAYKLEILEAEKLLDKAILKELERGTKELEKETEETVKETEETVKMIPVTKEEIDDMIEKAKKGGKKLKKKVPYNQFSKGPVSSEKGDLSDLASKYQTTLVENAIENHIKAPHIITAVDYEKTKVGYGQETLMYYEIDDTLTDLSEKLIDNVDELLGPDALVSFGVTSDDPDIVYVRNLKNETDYEVIRLHKSYQQEILGIRPEIPKSKMKVKKPNGHSEESE
jgi:hypothetical protein